MIIVGSSNKTVVGNVHQLPQILDAAYNIVYILLRGNACSLRLLLDLLTMLIGAGEEHHIAPLHSFIPCHCISSYRAIGVANMQLVRRVINRGGNVEFFSTHDDASCIFR